MFLIGYRVTHSPIPGKQIVYHALQDPQDTASMEGLAAMDQEIHELREKITGAKSQERLLRANLIALNATTSLEDLRVSAITLESEKQKVLARLESLRSGSVTPVSARDKAVADEEWKEWVRKAHTRKKICMELWDFCTEELQEGQTKQDLWV